MLTGMDVYCTDVLRKLCRKASHGQAEPLAMFVSVWEEEQQDRLSGLTPQGSMASIWSQS